MTGGEPDPTYDQVVRDLQRVKWRNEELRIQLDLRFRERSLADEQRLIALTRTLNDQVQAAESELLRIRQSRTFKAASLAQRMYSRIAGHLRGKAAIRE